MASTKPDTWQAIALSIYPEMFPGPLGMSLAGTALRERVWSLQTVDIRDHAFDGHGTVDGVPFGGGAGMVMRADVIDEAIRYARRQTAADLPFVYLTPRGCPLTRNKVRELAAGPGVMVLCGRFEGVDERVLKAYDADEISIGDFVLSGGEIPALVLFDACVRLLPGVMGSAESLSEESFERGLLEYPHYTRPRTWSDRTVPDVLLSGHHARIEAWRLDQAERITRERRPDLWAVYAANKL